ncbi:XAC2610-related protein [Flaviaesturariibacter amylovorans]|uniref:VCBS repeat-containing protein n=1 Tax=Flaviaesturariibacter amylovorans TaxID=1084520 RepID=A0ABP8HRR2_9BACT
MKTLRLPTLVPVLFSGFALLLLASCQEAAKRPSVSQRHPDGAVRFAAYSEGPVRTGKLRVALNGDVWEGELTYRGESLESLHVKRCTHPTLKRIFKQKEEEHFQLPLLPGTDTVRQLDLTERWVTHDFSEGGRIVTQDINFDGHTDLLLFNAQESGASNQQYDLWVYDASKKDYCCWNLPERTGLGLWEVDRKRRRLTLGYAQPDGAQVMAVYKVLHDTTVQLVKRDSL